MRANRMTEVFETLNDLTPVQRWAVGQVLRAFPTEASPPSRLMTAKAQRQQHAVLAFVEQRCEFAGAVTTDEELFEAFKQWCGVQFASAPTSQNGLAMIICESFPDRVRRRRMRTETGFRPRAVSGIKLRGPSTSS